jgi:hypothetical protein
MAERDDTMDDDLRDSAKDHLVRYGEMCSRTCAGPPRVRSRRGIAKLNTFGARTEVWRD